MSVFSGIISTAQVVGLPIVGFPTGVCFGVPEAAVRLVALTACVRGLPDYCPAVAGKAPAAWRRIRIIVINPVVIAAQGNQVGNVSLPTMAPGGEMMELSSFCWDATARPRTRGVFCCEHVALLG